MHDATSGAMEKMTPGVRISVIIPTYNRRASLLATLEGLARQSAPSSLFEALVISDGSTDGTLDACRALSTPYRLRLFDQTNAGPAVARNVGVREADAPLLLFLDDDVIPDPSLVAEHLRFHTEGAPRAIIGPLLPPKNARLQPWVQWEEVTLVKQYDALLAGRWRPTPRQFYTGNASVSRDAVLAAGGFNPAFTRAEDIELAYRLQQRGVRFDYAPRAVGWHYAQRSFRAWLRTPYAYGRNDVVMGREQGRTEVLEALGGEFHSRHRWLRWVARICVGRPVFGAPFAWLVGALAYILSRLPDPAGARLAGAGYSLIFNLRYWDGVASRIGRQAFWKLVHAYRPNRKAVTASAPSPR